MQTLKQIARSAIETLNSDHVLIVVAKIFFLCYAIPIAVFALIELATYYSIIE